MTCSKCDSYIDSEYEEAHECIEVEIAPLQEESNNA